MGRGFLQRVSEMRRPAGRRRRPTPRRGEPGQRPNPEPFQQADGPIRQCAPADSVLALSWGERTAPVGVVQALWLLAYRDAWRAHTAEVARIFTASLKEGPQGCWPRHRTEEPVIDTWFTWKGPVYPSRWWWNIGVRLLPYLWGTVTVEIGTVCWTDWFCEEVPDGVEEVGLSPPESE